MHAEKIIAVRKIGIAPTVDITVKNKSHTFYADGVIGSNSHAMGYAETGYWCAIAKAHFPLHFYTAWLFMAEEKQKPREEVSELISDSKSDNIEILPPSLYTGNTNFQLESGKIRFGLGNIKGIGDSKVCDILIKVDAVCKLLNKPVSSMTWNEILIYLLPTIGKTASLNLIAVGALSKFGLTRTQMAYEYQKLMSLKPSEIKFIQNNPLESLSASIAHLYSTAAKEARKDAIESVVNSLNNPPEKLNDSIEYVSNVETSLLGISISCSKLDACDTSSVNCSCSEFADVESGSNRQLTIGVIIERLSPWRPKNSPKPLAFMTCRDESGSIEVMAGDKLYEQYNNMLFQGNTVVITGVKDKKGRFNIKKVDQI